MTVGSIEGQYLLTTLSDPIGGGTVSRDPDQFAFDPGSAVTLTAEPEVGYNFSGWSGGGCSGTAPCTVIMNDNTAVTASFTPIEYSLTVTTPGNGTVSRSPDKATYHYGDVVQLTAEPASLYGFKQWGGDLAGSANPASITIDGNKTVTAEFIQGYTLVTDPVGGGAVTRYPDQAVYMPGQQVTLTAFPALNWVFSGWSGDGGCSGTGTCVVTMNDNKSVTATFTQTGYALVFSPTGSGTLTKDPDQASYSFGQRVTVTANPEPGWTFYSWGDALTGSVNPNAIISPAI